MTFPGRLLSISDLIVVWLSGCQLARPDKLISHIIECRPSLPTRRLLRGCCFPCERLS